MDTESPKAERKHNTTRSAMKFLKRNPTPEGNEAGDTSGNKAGENSENNRGHNKGTSAFDHIGSSRFGEELASDAAIWKIYEHEVQELDRELVEGHQRSLDTISLLATLFSGIVSIFVIESKSLLQQDPADVSASLLFMIAQSQHRIELGFSVPSLLNQTITTPEFVPSVSAWWVNGLWLAALGLSLSTAFIAMLVKEWLIIFHSSRSRSTGGLVFVRQSVLRIKGLEDWGALRVVDILPTLLHLSLLLFSMGLVVYLWEVDTTLAIVFAGVFGIALVFYVVASVLGIIYQFCPFVTGLFRFVRMSAKDSYEVLDIGAQSDSTSQSMSNCKLQALVWLSKHTTDPIILDSAYQAIAGLHQSPYTVLDLTHPPSNLSSNTKSLDKPPLAHHVTSIQPLLLRLYERFDRLLDGTLDIASAEPPVCRYVNSIIALGAYTERSAAAPPLQYWLDIWERVHGMWTSNMPKKSISGSNFAGVLIAEMDVFARLMSLLHTTLSTEYSIPGREEGPVIPEDPSPAPSHLETVDKPPQGAGPDGVPGDCIVKLHSNLAEWLDLSLKLLEYYAKGKTCIEPYLVNGLLRALSEGGEHLKCIYPVLCSHNLDPSVPQAGENSLKSLKILIFLLSQCKDPESASKFQSNELLRMYSHVAPVVLRWLKQQDEPQFDHLPDFYNLDPSPLESQIGVQWALMHYMMPLTSYISALLPDFPQYQPAFSDALELAQKCAFHDTSSALASPRQALRNHIDDYISILQFFGSTESKFDLATEGDAYHLCLLAIYPRHMGVHANALYIPPLCFRTLIRLFSLSFVSPGSAKLFTEAVVTRLQTPSESLSLLPPQASLIPEPEPPIEYLRQFTRFAGCFTSLAKSCTDENYPESVVPAIARITILAANRDPTLAVEPVELQAPAVPGFLEALSSALPYLSSREEERDLYNRFIIAASILLVVACEEPESRDQIEACSGRTRVISELRDHKSVYLDIVDEEEYQRLVNGLSAGEIDESDGESNDGSGSELGGGTGVAAVPTTSEVIELDIN